MPAFNRRLPESACIVDCHRADLIGRITQVMPLADRLRSLGMLHVEAYEEIRAAKTSQEKMRELFKALDSGGDRVKSAFYCTLRDIHPYLLQDLEGQANRSRRKHLPSLPLTPEGMTGKHTVTEVPRGPTLMQILASFCFLLPFLHLIGQFSQGWMERYWRAWDEDNTHHTNVANAFGSDIYVEVRGPHDCVYTAQIPHDSHESFQTEKGQVTVKIFADDCHNKVLVSKAFDSDISVIVKNDNGNPYFVRSKYGKVWQEEEYKRLLFA
ncbi:uncharacterized protein LOC143134507 isoform X2 [Alosa pseudoharengus]|uniref:uncharacterized protein LOC143134507 isoform X2 n=1 Tax=Alosa pseudoharengus TaxID=34774 RepID=UPI003F88F14C